MESEFYVHQASIKLTFMNPLKLNKQNLDEVVFENRNKAYGAYALRKGYADRINLSLSLTLLPLLFLLIYGLIRVPFKDIPKLIGSIDQPKEKIKPKIDDPPLGKIDGLVSGFEFILDPNSFAIVPDKKIPKTIEKRKVNQLVTAVVQNITGLQAAQTGMIGSGLPGIGGVPGVLGGSGGLGQSGGTEEILDVSSVGVMANFPGGMDALYEYIGKNLNYPSLARENAKEGRVVLSFVIGKDGSIQSVSVERGIGFGCDEEAERVVSNMPVWEPASQNGKPVAVRMILPIVFRLQ